MEKKQIPMQMKLALAIALGVAMLLPLYLSRQEKNASEETAIVQEFSDNIDVDIITRHCLPSLTRMSQEDREKYVDSLQVMKKFKALGLNEDIVLHLEKNYEETKKQIDLVVSKANEGFLQAENVEFIGLTGEELQSCINSSQGKKIEIKSELIEVRQGIDLTGNTAINGNGVKIKCTACDYAFKCSDSSKVSLQSLDISGECDYGIILDNADSAIVSDCSIHGMKEKGITIVNNSRNCIVQDSRVYENGAGGIYISDSSSYIELLGNDVVDNKGTSNWMAGIVITNASSSDPTNIWESFNEEHRCPSRDRMYADGQGCPNHIVIEDNNICSNNSSGIYSDGSYLSCMINNNIIENDKEGTCLDNGTIGLYMKNNLVKRNGYRNRQTDRDLELDFVIGAGRDNDGSAKAKLPGISIDNAAYNIVDGNIVDQNGGGGVKMVRTGIRNLIMENVIKDNNWENDAYHFFGIEIGSATADSDDTAIDYVPGYENIICRNTISGRHWSGIFIGEGGYVNDVFDNVIMEPEYFSVESVGTEFNSIVNNVSNMPVRDEYLGARK